MNLLIFIREKAYINLTFLLLFSFSAQADWKVDLSRRTQSVRSSEYHNPQNPQPTPNEGPNIFSLILNDTVEPSQELVVLNTESGFIPSSLRVRVGQKYKVTVVNVNEKNKNISFVLDAFSEHHSTYYGVIKSFYISPKKEGVYSYICPETSAQGKVIVYSNAKPRLRQPASEDEE